MNTPLVLLAISLALAAVGLAFAMIWLRTARRDRETLRTELDGLRGRFSKVLDADAERARVLAELEQERAAKAQEIDSLRHRFNAESADMEALQSRVRQLQAEFRALDEEANLQSFGLYQPHYSFADSERYQRELVRIRDRQKEMVKQKEAAVCHVEWTVEGSRSKGKKSTGQALKLMLRAFNGECDAAIAKVRYNNITVMETRIDKAFEAINGLAEVQRCEIVREYLKLKLEELHLVHEYEEKVQEEREEQRRIREQMRDEEIAQRELEKARQEAEKEERRYESALEKARREVESAAGAKQLKLQAQIEELERRLQEAHANKERAIARAQLTRSGHVYVISNVGSFGEEVFKVGMTRRLDPLERIRELGDASVPFNFDIHAVIYCDDAPALENKLHRAFNGRRINRVNERKEFFRVSIEEIAAAVREHHCAIELTKHAEAAEYRRTLAILEEEQHRGAGGVPSLAAPAIPTAGVA